MTRGIVLGLMGAIAVLGSFAPGSAHAESAAIAAALNDPATPAQDDDMAMPMHQPELRAVMDMPRDQGFVTELLLMKAHLQAGRELYVVGRLGEAMAHLSHPLDELYDDLFLQLQARGLSQFCEQLQSVVDAARAGASAGAVTAGVTAVLSTIDTLIASVPADVRQEPGFVAAVATALLKSAEQDFGASLEDGKIVSIVEYQDSLAFFVLAREVVSSASATLQARNAVAYDQLQKQIKSLAPLWLSLTPPSQVALQPDEIERSVSAIVALTTKFE